MGKKTWFRPKRAFGLLVSLSTEEKVEARKNIDESGGATSRFWILLVLSTVIAAFGLLINSAAVIIGAMIIAPLMGPIVASALAIDGGDTPLLIKALIAEVLGVIVAIAIGALIGFLPFELGLSNEMLARTNPTLYDLFIAVASGLAGAYAMVDSKVSNTLAGVAISVALVPPLACCGLFIALGHPAHALGAILLFLANFLAIQIGAGIVFFVYGVADLHELRERPTLRTVFRFGPSLVMLLSIGAFMTSTLVSVAKDRALEAGINRILSKEIGARTGGQLDRVIRRGMVNGRYEVVAVALTPQPFEPSQVALIEKALTRECRPDIHLIVRSLSSSDADSSGQVFLTQEELGRRKLREEEQTTLSRATEVMNQHLSSVPGARLVNLVQTRGDKSFAFTALVRTPTAIVPSQISEIQKSLTVELRATALLTIRSVLTRDADANRFLYDPVANPERLSSTEIALRARIRDAVSRRITAIDGAVLTEMNVIPVGAARRVVAVVEAPTLIQPEQVAQYQADLRKFINPGISLEVRSTVAGAAGPNGWSRSEGQGG